MFSRCRGRAYCILNKMFIRRLFASHCKSLSINNCIAHVLRNNKIDGEVINVKGWVKSIRSHKGVTFLAVNDGTSLTNLQVVIPDECQQTPVAAKYGTSVEITGVIKKSQGQHQEKDLVADMVKVLGECDNKTYPFKARKPHSSQYTRQFLHLRPKTKAFAALLRIRNQLTQALHNSLQKDGFLEIHTPILTSNDCEGAGEVFQVETTDKDVEMSHREKNTTKNQFFGTPAYLTVSGQLHLEAITGGVLKGYTLGPTFRAENSRGRHHLSEFYMLEAEVSFLDTLDELIEVIQKLVTSSVSQLRDSAAEDLNWHWKNVAADSDKQKELIDKLVQPTYKRLTYTEAIEILSKHPEQFSNTPKWGCDLQKEHEHFLVKHCGDHPVFVTDYPTSIKPFYMKANPESSTVAALDLLVPGVGELCGGSLRETSCITLEDRIQAEGSKDNLDWYLDLRRFGSVPHGGFGMGLERLLMAITGISNIRDAIPFPRSPNNCKL